MKTLKIILAVLLVSSFAIADSGHLGGSGGGGGGGNVIGPVVGTDNAIARFNGDGQHLKNSAVYVGDDRSIGGASTFSMDSLITFDGIGGGAAIDGTRYQIGRDADATNQVHFNVPTGASFEFSVNDSPQMTMNSTSADFKDNIIYSTTGIGLGADGFAGCVGGYCATFNITENVTDFSGVSDPGYWTSTSAYVTLDPSADLDSGGLNVLINVHDYQTYVPNTSTKDFGELINFYYYTQMQGSGHVDALVNVQNGSIIAGTRSADENVAYQIQSGHFGTGGNITNDYTMEFQTPSHGNGGTMTNHWGVRMDDQEFGTNSWAIQTHGGKVEFGSPTGKDPAFLFTDDDVTNPFSAISLPTHMSLGIVPLSSTVGGAKIIGVSDGDGRPLEIDGFYGTADPTDGQAAITLSAAKHDGAGGLAVLGSAETILKVANSSTREMTMLGNGNVSFGSADPDYSLEVLRGAGSDVSLALGDGDVTNPFSSTLQSDTFFHVGPVSSTIGGAQVSGVTDGDAIPLNLRGLMGTASPSNSTAYVRLFGAKTNGSGGLSDVGNSETLFEVVNNSLGSSFPVIMCTGGRLCAMSSQNPNARLDISSNGSDSSTHSFRVTDSGDGRTKFNVRNDNHTTIGDRTAAEGAFLNVNAKVETSGTSGVARFLGAALTGMTASTENILFDVNLGQNYTWAVGDITTERAARIAAPTFTIGGGGGIITNGVTFSVGGAPTAGSSTSITNPRAVKVDSGISEFGGGLYQSMGTIASADKLDPAGANNVLVTGNIQIDCIKKGSATAGTELTIDVLDNGGFRVKNNGCAQTADSLDVALAGGVDYDMTDADTLTLMLTVHTGTYYWVEKSRAVITGPVPPP